MKITRTDSVIRRRSAGCPDDRYTKNSFTMHISSLYRRPVCSSYKGNLSKFFLIPTWPVPVAARSKSWVCGCSPAEILGSNPTGGMEAECFVFSGSGLCDELITRPEESYRLWCVVVLSRNLANEEALAHWGLSKQKQTTGVLVTP